MLDRLTKIFEIQICNHCLGRQFAQLLSGYTNDERGHILRNSFAFAMDSKEIDYSKIDLTNFTTTSFRKNEDLVHPTGKNWPKGKFSCEVCDNFFFHNKGIVPIVKKMKKDISGKDFKTFIVGTRPSRDLLQREEKIWTIGGMEYAEPIKTHINREIGKEFEKQTGKKADLLNPDLTFLVDLSNNKIETQFRSLYIFGFYNKLKRGIPQSRWGTPGLYKTSVEEEIGRPLLKLTKGKDHKFHGAGREDKDALCFGWRSFVIEILEPKNRDISLSKFLTQANKSKKVQIKSLKFVTGKTVKKVKELRLDKTYRALVKTDKPIEKKQLEKIKELRGLIKQNTPTRVKHRRSDLLRKRIVREISTKYINKNTFEIKVKSNAGLYIKELISGDKGRTNPSVSGKLGVGAICKELDVIAIERPKNI